MTKKPKKAKPVKAWCWKGYCDGLWPDFVSHKRREVVEMVHMFGGTPEGKPVRVEIREVTGGSK